MLQSERWISGESLDMQIGECKCWGGGNIVISCDLPKNIEKRVWGGVCVCVIGLWLESHFFKILSNLGVNFCAKVWLVLKDAVNMCLGYILAHGKNSC